ncbi:hypothetical protein B0T24DRAFT_692953 [Lasiosphaeria ovina]|uniref:HNH nuclease domain-containing protein n=1 Tax=Lasiosphaeria ovina TaxID=92902 RepID=A0AAE0JSW5_9PEZI|nr:hypothetical protein B0T24DRAFT_692953 [Lasiosphaeria ovina]
MATTAPLQAQRLPPVRELELRIRKQIEFYHPGYDSNSNLLLTLPRVDPTPSGPGYGVHHRTALLACQIIAGNAFDNSYLSLDRAGQRRVQVSPDGILTDEGYYFICFYPIAASFRDWEFPHGRIPDWWPLVNAGPDTTMYCGITNGRHSVEQAHLVPQEEYRWYQDNDMQQYGASGLNHVDDRAVDDRANLIPLRRDVHCFFNAQWFAIVPKIVTTNSSPQPSLQYVTHIITNAAADIISNNAGELWHTYQNTVVESLSHVHHAYLFARFAWAILSQAELFVTAAPNRHVIRISTDADGKIGYTTEYMTSPPNTKKRKAEDAPEDEDSVAE